MKVARAEYSKNIKRDREKEREMVGSSELKSIQFTAALDESIKILIETFRTIRRKFRSNWIARTAWHVRQYL